MKNVKALWEWLKYWLFVWDKFGFEKSHGNRNFGLDLLASVWFLKTETGPKFGFRTSLIIKQTTARNENYMYKKNSTVTLQLNQWYNNHSPSPRLLFHIKPQQVVQHVLAKQENITNNKRTLTCFYSLTADWVMASDNKHVNSIQNRRTLECFYSLTADCEWWQVTISMLIALVY